MGRDGAWRTRGNDRHEWRAAVSHQRYQHRVGQREVPESLTESVRREAAVTVSTPALPGMALEGKVNAILPDVSLATRTLRVRIELANPDTQLVPGMFVSLRFALASATDVVRVPSEAIIETGTRRVVLLAEGEGKFRPVNVEVAPQARSNGVRAGLTSGQKVVVSGQFLIDSEASLKETECGCNDRQTDPRRDRPSVLVLLATGMIAAWGLWAMLRIPLDAIPTYRMCR